MNGATGADGENAAKVLDLSMKSISGETVNLSKYKGQVILFDVV
jgi:glutathione peroxidase-family protein